MPSRCRRRLAEIVAEPTLLERAAQAREADDFEAAQALLEEVLRADPADTEALLALANLLEYELADYHGARSALEEIDRLGAGDPALQHRLATLEAWTDDGDAAMERLDHLLASTEVAPVPGGTSGAPTRADVLALIGDLHRWDGDRVRAAASYREAQAEDPANERAADGLSAVRTEVDLLIEDVERPGVGGSTLGLGDSDEFRRFDVGGAWRGVDGDWSWSADAGRRWLDGPSPDGGLQGLFVELSPARWWREGTVRTSLLMGSEWVREGELDARVGGSVELRPVRGGSLRAEYERGPAYPMTQTAQSAAARVMQDRLAVSLERPLSEPWSLSLQADLTILDATEDPTTDAVGRWQASVAASRAVSRRLSVGWSALALTYRDASPDVGGLRLFWDPATALATGPLATVRLEESDGWSLSARVNPGIATIDERDTDGFQTVPQLSGDVRLELKGSTLDSTIDLFYSQARVDGYRTLGVRASFTAPKRIVR